MLLVCAVGGGVGCEFARNNLRRYGCSHTAEGIPRCAFASTATAAATTAATSPAATPLTGPLATALAALGAIS
jgi:hypothetical protein